ncbi:MAG TPA: hypothetical protein VLU23_18945 [Pseudolabrys sp.]|nr:hypothetical protein [Pseudolabrys sp.]
MKTSITSVLFAVAAASVSAAMTLPASAQTYKPRDQTCDNKSTARDKVQRPDSRCVNATSETYTNEAAERAGKAVQAFTAANPPQKTTDTFDRNKNPVVIYDGVNRNGDPYRIVVGGGGGVAGSGSASGLGGNGGGRGGRSAR